nr:MAG TPA: hypothetical protein [Caudoviricetes sp.]DAQ32234.1 MAG TPA: hypothetical protein [Caudoviricetes sp.]
MIICLYKLNIKRGETMAKTPEYTKKAIQNYNNKFDRIAVNLPKGTKNRIKVLTGKSCNAYVSELVVKDLDSLENK